MNIKEERKPELHCKSIFRFLMSQSCIFFLFHRIREFFIQYFNEENEELQIVIFECPCHCKFSFLKKKLKVISVINYI